jgi:hypothetical protein
MAEHRLRMEDSGAPRGERRYWHVVLNGMCIFETTSRAQAATLHDRLKAALALGVAGTDEPKGGV